jgi:hypothetical protein
MISFVLIATWTTDIEITNGLVKNGFIYMFIFGLIQIITAKLHWTWTKKLMTSTGVFGLYLIFHLFTDWRGDWKTQTKHFQNNLHSNRTIEFQMQDKGALGYNRRTVDRIKLFPFISWIKILTPEDVENIDSLTWDKVDIGTNELKLRGG